MVNNPGDTVGNVITEVVGDSIVAVGIGIDVDRIGVDV